MTRAALPRGVDGINDWQSPRDGSAANVGVSARRRFEIELPIVEQGELELSANLGCVRQIQEELSSAVPMGPTPIFR
jgi:hypothetical protein